MDIGVVEYGRILAICLSVVATHANMLPFIRFVPIEYGMNVGQLSMENFLKRDYSMCGRMKLQTGGQFFSTF